MPYALDYDHDGEPIYGQGITLGRALERIGVDDLKVGDVLVWYQKPSDRFATGDNKKHSAIRDIGRGAYSHAGVFVGDGMSIDAGPRGVDFNAVEDLVDAFEICTVLRCPGPYAVSWANDAKAYLELQVEERRRYANIDAILLPVRRWAVSGSDVRRRGVRAVIGRLAIFLRTLNAQTRGTYCSQLVVEAYAPRFFGEHHVAQAVMTPNDFLTGSIFEHVGYMSTSENPDRHPLDVNIPFTGMSSSTWAQWRRQNRAQ